MKQLLKTMRRHKGSIFVAALAVIFVPLVGMDAAVAGSQNIGKVAENIYGSFGALARLITAASYLAGLGFAIGAVMKFKQHKDNPTQIPIGTPIALLFIAAALLFLPTILGVTGATIFGTEGGDVAGPSGVLFGVD